MWPCIAINFLIMKPTRCTNFSKFILEMKLYMFRTDPLSIIRSNSLSTQQLFMSYNFRAAAGSGWNCSSILILLFENCPQTCMTYTIAECTVNISWWWTEELSETCRVSFQKKFEKLVHLVGFSIRKCMQVLEKKLKIVLSHKKYVCM
jgi:hypothetical protein